MKKIQLIAIMLFMMAPTISFGQDITKAYTIKNVSNESFYDKTYQWVAMSFNSSDDVIQYESKENSTFILKGNLGDSFSTSFTTKITYDNEILAINFSKIESMQYGYIYGDDSNCYTKRCRKSHKKWMDNISIEFIELSDSLINDIKN